MVPAEAGGGLVSGFRRPGRPLRGEPVPAPFPGAAVHGGQAVSAEKDGRTWRFGTEADVAWIEAGISIGFEITSAIPPVFDSYATIIVPDKEEGRGEDLHRVLQILRAQSPEQPWWLGYLDTGADDVVFGDARMVELISSWWYVLVEAGPDQAAGWRQDLTSWRAPGPDLIFPADRSWLMSWLWDDDWRCLGGPEELIARFLAEPQLQVRRVRLGEHATPPGHVAR
jgi:hypothetical protein